MPFNELSRGAVGFAQEQDEIAAANEPRQAWVQRSEGNGVWVRFGGEPVGAPASWFPSTVAGLSAGAMGWVYRLGGKKGLFVATGVPLSTMSPRMTDNGSFSLSSPGSNYRTGTSYTFTGLTPGAMYNIVLQMEIRSTGTNERRFYPAIEAVGASTVAANGTTGLADRNQEVESLTAQVSVQPSVGGEVTVTAGVGWSSGTVSVNFVSALYSITS